MAEKIIRHQVSAGNNFDGTVPTGPPTTVGNKDTFPEQAGGGRFEIGGSGVVLQTICVEPDANADWSLELLDGSDVLIREIASNMFDSQDPPQPIHSANPHFITCEVNVAAGEKLSFTSTSATAAIAAEIIYDDGL